MSETTLSLIGAGFLILLGLIGWLIRKLYYKHDGKVEQTAAELVKLQTAHEVLKAQQEAGHKELKAEHEGLRADIHDFLNEQRQMQREMLTGITSLAVSQNDIRHLNQTQSDTLKVIEDMRRDMKEIEARVRIIEQKP